MNPFYITTPIYYVNDVPHLGHAYTTIVADALARYQRSRGRKVFFATGTDEHGQKIEEAAAEQGMKPAQLADQVVARFRETWTNLNISHDDFIRTTEARHKLVVEKLWRRMADKDDIYLGEYEGLYCVGCEEYYTEGQLDADEKCPVHGTKVQHLKQPSYFFRMSKYQDALLEHFEKNPDFVQPEIRKNEILSFIKGGLRDLSISRTTFDWGIRTPDDPKHVIYVWLDALTNYLSVLGDLDSENNEAFWPATVHLIGKDILRFHAVYWPTMLLSAGLPLPKQILAHGWWTINGQKMSKSLGNVVEPNTIAKDVGRDALRYFVLRETPLGSDGDFSHEGLIQRINSELGNDLGNLLNRSLAMAGRYCDGQVPALPESPTAVAEDKTLVELATASAEQAAKHFEACAPSRALEVIWELVRGTNKYIDSCAPYKLIKDPEQKARVGHIVANFLEALRWIAMMVDSIMPDKAAEMRHQLGMGETQASWPESWCGLTVGSQLVKGERLFPRIEDDDKAKLFEKWTGKPPADGAAAKPESKKKEQAKQQQKKQKKEAPAKEDVTISFDEFCRLDLRVARIAEAQRVEGADRLLQLQVDLGKETRQVVAGIAEAYSPEELVGKQVIFVANLKPAKIRGIRSEGMILAAGGKKVLALSALDREVPAGTEVR
jgi:methionyl-tRNA synthetase